MIRFLTPLPRRIARVCGPEARLAGGPEGLRPLKGAYFFFFALSCEASQPPPRS